MVLLHHQLVLGVVRKERMCDLQDLRLLEEELSHSEAAFHVPLHPEAEGGEATAYASFRGEVGLEMVGSRKVWSLGCPALCSVSCTRLAMLT